MNSFLVKNMKIIYVKYTVLLLLLWSFSGCNEAERKTENSTEVVGGVETPADPIYDPAKGSHIIAPEMTKLITDTLGIVMYELTMNPGDSLVWHEHPHHTFYVLKGGTVAVYFKDMEKQVLELPVGLGMYGAPSGDAAVNIGESNIVLLTHDIYSLNLHQ